MSQATTSPCILEELFLLAAKRLLELRNDASSQHTALARQSVETPYEHPISKYLPEDFACVSGTLLAQCLNVLVLSHTNKVTTPVTFPS